MARMNLTPSPLDNQDTQTEIVMVEKKDTKVTECNKSIILSQKILPAFLQIREVLICTPLQRTTAPCTLLCPC